MPLSNTLADAVVRQLALAGDGAYDSPELQCVRPLLEIQQQWSALPTPHTLLAETLATREGSHLFLYPFAGRHVHLGLASLLAWRVAQHEARTFSIAVNDYGFELLSATEVDWPALLPQVLRLPEGNGEAGGADAALLHEVLASLNAGELAQRRFREIARAFHALFLGDQDQLGAEGLHHRAALHRQMRRHDQHHAVALDGRGHGQGDAGVARGGFDQRVAGLDFAALLGAFDHGQGRAVFHRAGRVVALEFAEDDVALGLVVGCADALQ
eukprot:gene55034-75402_t